MKNVKKNCNVNPELRRMARKCLELMRGHCCLSRTATIEVDHDLKRERRDIFNIYVVLYLSMTTIASCKCVANVKPSHTTHRTVERSDWFLLESV